MLNDEIWQDPNTCEELHYDENKKALSDAANKVNYTVNELDIIDFTEQDNDVEKAASTVSRRLRNGFSSDEKIRSSYLQFLEIWPQDYVLEVNVGKASNIKYLQTKANYVGVDSSMSELEKAAKTIEDHQLNLTLCHAQAEALPFKDNIFGCVYHDGDQTPFKDMPKAIKEMVRVAKSGAKIMIMSNNIKGDGIVDALPDNVRDIKTQDIRKGKYYVVTCYKK